MEKGMSLADGFMQYFDIDLAVSEKQKQEVYKVRYRVYCDEFGYEPMENFSDQQEFDEFDTQSLHCLITHKSSGIPAGCVRLVSGAEKGLLPFEKYCSGSLDKAILDDLALDRNTVCEISRLAVDGAFRRRAGEDRTRFGEIDAFDCNHQERRTFSLISVVGFLAATALTDLSGRRNVFAMMEPFLPRLLRRSGITFGRVGGDIEYHGLRAPHFIKTQDALEGMHPDLAKLYAVILAKISGQYQQWSQGAVSAVI